MLELFQLPKSKGYWHLKMEYFSKRFFRTQSPFFLSVVLSLSIGFSSLTHAVPNLSVNDRQANNSWIKAQLESTQQGKTSVDVNKAKQSKSTIIPSVASTGINQAPSSINDPSQDSDWLEAVQKDIAQREYHANRSEKGVQATNRQQNLRTIFSAEGIQVEDRTSDKLPLVGIRYAGLHRQNTDNLSPDPVKSQPAGKPTYSGNRVEIQHGKNITEWFINSEAGLEQGFNLYEKPAGQGLLVLTLDVQHATPSLQHDSIQLKTKSGRVLNYGKLKVFDANEKILDAYFSINQEKQIQIAFDDNQAVYPLVVDPLLTADNDWQVSLSNSDIENNIRNIGDVNGDGYDDVIIGTHSSYSSGAAYIYLGSINGLTTSSVWQFNIGQGSTLAGAGDVNGDGYDDVIIGSPYYFNGSTDEGAAFVFLGSKFGPSDSPSWQVESNQASGLLGSLVISAGDVNNDGFDEVIIGASGLNQSYLYLGSSTGLKGLTSSPITTQPSPYTENVFPDGWQTDGWMVTTDSWHEGPTSLRSKAIGDGELTEIVVEGYFEEGHIEFARKVSSHGWDYLKFYIDGIQKNAWSYDYDWAVFSYPVSAGYHTFRWAYIKDYYSYTSGSDAAWIDSIKLPTFFSGNAYSFSASLDSADSILPYGNIASVGDVDGNGFDDVVVGIPTYVNGEFDEGSAFLYAGSQEGLSSTASWQVESNQSNAKFGTSVAKAGDVNGDGFNDVIVGAPYYNYGYSNEGAAFLFLGSVSGLANSPSWQGRSKQTNGSFGSKVSTAGDLNGDGLDDVVISASGLKKSFVYLGENSVFGLKGTTPETSEWQLSSDNFKGSGDFNGDGLGDLVLANPIESTVYAYYGGKNLNLFKSYWGIELEQEGVLEINVASAGDLNGDGYDDVAVGVPDYDYHYNNEGAVFVYMGSGSELSITPAWQARSNLSEGRFGENITHVNVNNDLYDDLIISGSYGVYAYHGSENGLSGMTLPTNSNTVRFSDGSGGFYLPGWSTSGVHIDWYWDENNSYQGNSSLRVDGYDRSGYASYAELSVSGYFEAGSISFARKVNIPNSYEWLEFSIDGNLEDKWRGNSSWGVVTYPIDAGYHSFEWVFDVNVGSAWVDSIDFPQFLIDAFALPSASDWSVSRANPTVANAGDVNGDGIDDLVIGAPTLNEAFSNEGAVFIYHGSDSGLSNSPSWQATSGQLNGQFGSSVSSAGDVNGDYVDDVIIGANGLGKAFVYHGQLSAGLMGMTESTSPASYADGSFPSGWQTDGWTVVNDVFYEGSTSLRSKAIGDSETTELFVEGYFEAGLLSFAVKVSSAEYDQLLFYIDGVRYDPYNWYGEIDWSLHEYNINSGFHTFRWVYSKDAQSVSGSDAAWIDSIILPDFSYINSYTSATPANAQWETTVNDPVVSLAGDVNGDGVGDVVIGSPYYDNTETDEGVVYLYEGSASTGLSTTPSWQHESNINNGLLGNNVSSAGDVNGDGFDDVLVGPALFIGSSAGLPSQPNWELSGLSDYINKSASAGDINGDGYSDIIVQSQSLKGAAVYLGQGDASIIIDGPMVNSTSEDQISITYNFSLTKSLAADASVTLDFSSSDLTEGTVSPSQLVFDDSNWHQIQSITVTGENDNIIDGDQVYKILIDTTVVNDLSYQSVALGDLVLKNTDNDFGNFTVSAISGNTTEASGTATFSISMDQAPSEDITVYLESNDLTEGTVNPTSIVFSSSDWTEKIITLTGVDDNELDGDISYRINLSAELSDNSKFPGGIDDYVVLVNEDNEVDNTAPSVTTINDSGIYQSLSLTLGCSDSQSACSVFYTLDGSEPSLSSFFYSGSISLTSNTDVKAIAIDTFGNTSSIITRLYIVDDVSPVIDSLSMSNKDSVDQLSEISGSALDDNSGIQSIEVSIFDGVNYLTSEGISESQVWLDASDLSLDNSWSTWKLDTLSINWVHKTRYTLTIRVTDLAGNSYSETIFFLFYNGEPMASSLGMILSDSSIVDSENQKLDIIVQLSSLDDPDFDLSNYPVNLEFTKPDNSKIIIGPYATNSEGEFSVTNIGLLGNALLDGGGDLLLDQLGNWSVKAIFDGVSSLESNQIIKTFDVVFGQIVQTNNAFEGFIQTQGDEDWYQVYFPTTGRVSIKMTVPDGASHELALYDGTTSVPTVGSVPVAISSTALQGARTATLHHVITTAGWYYLKIHDISSVYSNSIEPYKVLIDFYQPDSDFPVDAVLDSFVGEKDKDSDNFYEAFNFRIGVNANYLGSEGQQEVYARIVSNESDLSWWLEEPFLISGVDSEYQYIELNERLLSSIVNTNATFTVELWDSTKTIKLASALVKDTGGTTANVSVDALLPDGYAIIIQGSPVGSSDYSTNKNSTDHIFDSLDNSGLWDIFYLNAEQLPNDGVNALADSAELEYLITDLLPDKVLFSPAPVYVFYVGERDAENNAFMLNEDVIAANELSAWVDVLEQRLTGNEAFNQPRVFVFDSSFSGKAIPDLSKQGRTIITSSRADESAFKITTDSQAADTRAYFINNLLRSFNGTDSLNEAFSNATEEMELYAKYHEYEPVNNPYFDNAFQHPLLDDNGDGIGSNTLFSGSLDGDVASQVLTPVLPSATNVSSYSTSFDLDSQIIYGSEVTEIPISLTVPVSANIDRAWVEITFPDQTPNDVFQNTQHESLQRTRIEFAAPLTGTLSSVFSGSNLAGGRYQVIFFVRDSVTGHISQKVTYFYINESGNQAPSSEFSLLSPSEGEDVNPLVIFKWEQAVDPEGDDVYYLFELKEADYLIHQELMSGNSFVIEDLDTDTLFTWSVTAIDEFGNKSLTKTGTFYVAFLGTNFGIIRGIIQSDRDFRALSSISIFSGSNGYTELYNPGSGEYVQIFLDFAGSSKVNLSFEQSGYLDNVIPGIQLIDGAAIEVNVLMRSDVDGDGEIDQSDNCLNEFNADQSDVDEDGLGDVCDNDIDGDGVLNSDDEYETISLDGRLDSDGDGRPNECNASCLATGMIADTDDDNDNVPDESDAFPLINLDGRLDTDNDGAPDTCDSACLLTGMTADTDDDNDGYTDREELDAGTSPTNPNDYPIRSKAWKAILPLILN